MLQVSRVAFLVAAMVALIAVVVGMSPAVAAGEDDGLTLDNIFGEELFRETVPSKLMWLPDGSGFVFRDRTEGGSGLWSYDIARGSKTLVLDWEELTQKLKELRPAYTKPSMNDVNRHPGVGDRPTIDPQGRLYLGLQRNDLYAVDLDTGAIRTLSDDPLPELYAEFSPDGRRLAFARDGDLYWLHIATGTEHRLTDRGQQRELFNGVADWVYEEEFDVRRSFWWSPDSAQILFVQFDVSGVTTVPITDELAPIPALELQKYAKAGGDNAQVRLGVIDVGTGKTEWIPTGVGDGYLPRAGWLPDGSGVWYQMLNRLQNRLELRAATPGEGSSRLILAEQDEAWVNLRDDLHFVNQRRFVWSSERDGWRHLYLYDLEDGLVRRLSSGKWQVEEVYGLDAGRERVIFQANAEDPRERHIYAIALEGGEPELLTEASGHHSASLAPDGRHFLDTASSIDSPPRLDLYDVAGNKLRAIDEGRIPALADLAFNPPEFSSIEAEDGETLSTWLYRPPDFDTSKKYPVLVYVYGGPHAQEVIDEWGKTRHLYFQLLARKGLIVFCLDNRGSWGRGHAFETVIYRRLGEWELKDQLEGVRFLKSLPYVDRDRIGVYGGSYGGYMALTAMNRAPEHFKVGIAYAPVTHWELYDTAYTERYMGLPADNPDGYRDSAPLNHASGLAGPLLICHGTMDNNVHFQNSIRMVERYIEAGKLPQMMIYPRVRHGIRVSEKKLHFHRLKTEFLERHLIKHGPTE